MLYLPSTMDALSQTVFGSAGVLQYESMYTTADIYNSIKVIMQAVGIIFFVRGSILLVDAAEPGEQHGIKGLILIIASVFAININTTMSLFNTLLDYLLKYFPVTS